MLQIVLTQQATSWTTDNEQREFFPKMLSSYKEYHDMALF